jgi:hypothetical protein
LKKSRVLGSSALCAQLVIHCSTPP